MYFLSIAFTFSFLICFVNSFDDSLSALSTDYKVYEEFENVTPRKLIQFTPVVDYGNSNYLFNTTIYVAYLIPQVDDDKYSLIKYNVSLISVVEDMLQMKIVQWPYISTRQCPGHFHEQSSDSGHGLSHLQVWMEFTFFDHDVNEARFRAKPEYLISNSYSSVSGVFQSFQNGSLHKNDIPFLDHDIQVILEGNLQLNPKYTINEIKQSLRAELSKLKELDVLLLGPNTFGSNVESYNVAYAITRKTARILVENYDVCGQTMSSQFNQLASVGFIRLLTSSSLVFIDA